MVRLVVASRDAGGACLGIGRRDEQKTLTSPYEGLEMTAEPGRTLTICTAEPASPSADRLQVLGSWAATSGNDRTAPATAAAQLTSEN